MAVSLDDDGGRRLLVVTELAQPLRASDLSLSDLTRRHLNLYLSRYRLGTSTWRRSMCCSMR